MPTQPNPTPSNASPGSFLDELKQVQSKYQSNIAPSYPKQTFDIEDQIHDLPNSEKLSAGEKWIYKTLPGQSEKTWFKALMGFANSPAGKVLSFLDVGAEALERTLGLIPQLGQVGDPDFDLKEAWTAGTLFWDTANLPRFERDEKGKLRFRIDSDMPGVYAVNEARQKLSEGMSIEEVRAQYYTNLGALSLRAQLNDTWGHVLGDPLSWALGAVKPVQRLHAVRALALTTKTDIQYVEKLRDAANIAGNLQDVAKYTKVIEEASQTGKALTKAERLIINMTGGTPWLEDATKATKTQKFLNKFNPMALTPQARASELMDVMAANIGEYIIRPNWNKDPAEAVKMLSGIARGAIGQQWGHVAFTVQGRTLQGFSNQADAIGKTLLKEWTSFDKERKTFEGIATMLGKDTREVWKLAATDSELLMKKVIEAAQLSGNNVLMTEIQKGNLTAEILSRFSKTTPQEVLNTEEFYAKLAVGIQDVAMQQAIVQFGIKEKGIITKWADALKAWETIPFIKANPANAVRNIINNDMTLIGRGLYGTMSMKAIKNFWQGKYVPPQFSRAFGFAAQGDTFDDVTEFSVVSQRLTEALTGKITLADKVKRAAGAFSKKTGLDNTISAISQRAEQAASRRATTVAWMEFHQKYWNPKTGFTSIKKHISPDVLEQMERESPGLANILDDIAEAAGADSDKFARMISEGLENNPTTVMKAASERLGYDFQDVIGAETMHVLQDGLSDAIKNGRVRDFISGVKTQMEQHVDDMFRQHVENLPGIIKAQVQAGGQQQYYKVFAQASDELWGSHTEHAFRMSGLNDVLREARAAKDYEKANQIWNKILADSDAHYNRVWSKFEAYQDGLAQGAKAAGIPYPKEVKSAFSEIRSGWQAYFGHRNKVMKEFFEARLKGSEYKQGFDQIQAELTNMYKKMIGEEERLSTQVDDVIAASIPDKELQTAYVNFRDTVSQLRAQDKQKVIEFYEIMNQTPASEAPELWQKFWQERMASMEQIRQVESFGSAMMQGDPNSMRFFTGAVENVPATQTEGAFNIVDEFNKAGIPTATKTGNKNNIRILNTIKKYTGQKFSKIEDVPEDVVKSALEARALEQGAQAGGTKPFIPDVEKMLPMPQPIETAINQLNYGRGYAVLDAIEEAGIEAASRVTSKFDGLPQNVKDAAMKWVDNVNSDMSAFRSGATTYSLFRRDSALLNYNRRTNFDSWLGNVAPFAFWSTHSMLNWAIHSIDRPAMLTNYFRTRKIFETAGLKGQNMPSRLKGHIRLNLPFAPEWMGDSFLNPTRALLPFDNFMMPWEQAQQSKFQIDGKTNRTLETMLESGEISEQEYQDAITTKTGNAWDIAQARASEGGDQYDAMDFVQMTMTPHAPLMWAFNAARGQPNEIGAFTPMTRNIRNFAAIMGVEDWSNSPYNIEARVRKQMGLNAYDKWDDYRIKRMISNMAGTDFSAEESTEAMQIAALVESGQLDSAEAVKTNKIYAEAVRRSNIEFAGGTIGAFTTLLGIPLKSYPEGEMSQRKTGEEFSEAYDKYNTANKALDKFLAGREATNELIDQWEKLNPGMAKDANALTEFFDKHPEYESRLALFKKPEEILKTGMIDNVWAKWNDMPKLTQDEVKEQLGSSFNEQFLTKETRNYDAITPEQLQIWLKLINGKQIGFLSATDEAIIELNELRLTEPETAERVQVFYNRRNFDHDGWFELQQEYYKLPEGQERKNFVRENPDLKEYWDFRRKFMMDNPDLVKYLTDDPKQIEKASKMERNPEIAVPNAQEIRSILSPSMINLISEYQEGQTLPYVVRQNLNTLGQHYNLSGEEMLKIITASP